MTDPLPSKQVSLDDLKRAIEAVPEHPGPCIPGQNVDIWLALLHEHKNWALEAWRTAFEWREGWNGRFMDKALSHSLTNADMPLIDEGAEGMRLIREKLR